MKSFAVLSLCAILFSAYGASLPEATAGGQQDIVQLETENEATQTDMENLLKRIIREVLLEDPVYDADIAGAMTMAEDPMNFPAPHIRQRRTLCQGAHIVVCQTTCSVLHRKGFCDNGRCRCR